MSRATAALAAVSSAGSSGGGSSSSSGPPVVYRSTALDAVTPPYDAHFDWLRADSATDLLKTLLHPHDSNSRDAEVLAFLAWLRRVARHYDKVSLPAGVLPHQRLESVLAHYQRFGRPLHEMIEVRASALLENLIGLSRDGAAQCGLVLNTLHQLGAVGHSDEAFMRAVRTLRGETWPVPPSRPAAAVPNIQQWLGDAQAAAAQQWSAQIAELQSTLTTVQQQISAPGAIVPTRERLAQIDAMRKQANTLAKQLGLPDSDQVKERITPQNVYAQFADDAAAAASSPTLRTLLTKIQAKAAEKQAEVSALIQRLDSSGADAALQAGKRVVEQFASMLDKLATVQRQWSKSVVAELPASARKFRHANVPEVDANGIVVTTDGRPQWQVVTNADGSQVAYRTEAQELQTFDLPSSSEPFDSRLGQIAAWLHHMYRQFALVSYMTDLLNSTNSYVDGLYNGIDQNTAHAAEAMQRLSQIVKKAKELADTWNRRVIGGSIGHFDIRDPSGSTIHIDRVEPPELANVATLDDYLGAINLLIANVHAQTQALLRVLPPSEQVLGKIAEVDGIRLQVLASAQQYQQASEALDRLYKDYRKLVKWLGKDAGAAVFARSVVGEPPSLAKGGTVSISFRRDVDQWLQAVKESVETAARTLHEGDLAWLPNATKEQRDRIAQLRLSTAQRTVDIADLEAKARTALEQKQRLTAETEALEDEVRQLREARRAARANKQRIEEQVEELEAQIVAAQARRDRLRERLDELQPPLLPPLPVRPLFPQGGSLGNNTDNNNNADEPRHNAKRGRADDTDVSVPAAAPSTAASAASSFAPSVSSSAHSSQALAGDPSLGGTLSTSAASFTHFGFTRNDRDESPPTPQQLTQEDLEPPRVDHARSLRHLTVEEAY